MTLRPIPLLCALPLALTACTSLAPDYQAPAMPVPPTVGANQPLLPAQPLAPDSEAAQRITEEGPMPWARFIQDARLRNIVSLALDHNRDLRVTLLTIERARAQYGVERSALFPSVAATGAGSRSRTADDLVTAGRPNVSGQYSAQLGFSSYEIDFFGRVRNLNEAALQEFLRVAENRRSVQLSLVAEVANAWLTLDADARRLHLARETLRTRQQALDLTRQAHALGAASGLTLAQAQTTVDSARADVAAYVAQVAKGRNALALLTGTAVPDTLLPPSVAAAVQPGSSATPQLPPASEPATVLLAIPGDLPSRVLLHRPDVQAAEHQLRGTYANIGAARAAFFPSITLTASVGMASNQLSSLFDGGNGTWSFAPQIRLPIFDAGRNHANLRVAEVAQSTAIAQYEKTVQTAFREVADALADRATLAERLDAQRSLVEATQRALELSDARYRLGADNYLTLLDAQRSLYAAQQAQISLQLAEQVNRITLYKVLGGHWGDGVLEREDVEENQG